MLEAIHKLTGKKISAFKLTHDLEWQGKERDEFIAPYHEIGNWDEQLKKGNKVCNVGFVIRHKRNNGTDKEELVREHFRIITEGFVENPLNESEEHKLAKKYIYDNYEEIEIINWNNNRLADLTEVDSVHIERGIGNKRADVLIEFKKWHEVFGRGIAFEIQISPQTEEETKLRSFDRAAHGYSVCWLWSSDLINFTKRVKIVPYREALKEYDEQVIYEQEIKLSEIAKKARQFTEEQRFKIMQAVNVNEKILEDIKRRNQNDHVQLNENASKVLIDFGEKARQLKENAILSFSEIVNKKVTEAIQSLDLKNLIESLVKGNIQQIVDRDKMPCSYCSSTDTHEYLDCYLCYNCKKRTVKNVRQN